MTESRGACSWPGCVVRDRHHAECGDSKCAGCRSRIAEHGLLCSKHWAWFARDLSMCAELVLHARESLEPGRAAEDRGVKRGARKSQPAPLDLSAADAADELFALLASSTARVCEALGVRVPQLPVWRSGAVVHGFPASMSPRECAAVVARLVAWWRDRLDTIAGLPDVADVGPDLHQLVRVMALRWAAGEPPRHLPGVPCRQCDLVDMWWTPPNGVGWPVTVECHSCGYVAPESDLVRLTRLVEFEQFGKRVMR